MNQSTLVESHSKRQSRKAAASGWIGSALEYYDFFIYATAAALLFPQLFFPTDNPTVGIIVSLASFGVGYIARPIGAVVLGHLGDRHGRKTVLVYCMFLMGFSTVSIGLLPTYQQIGVWAPALLIFFASDSRICSRWRGVMCQLHDPGTRARWTSRLFRKLYASRRTSRTTTSGWGFPASRPVHAS